MRRGTPPFGIGVYRANAMADLPALLAFVDNACDALSADGDARFAMRLAVEEVFTNILEHGYRGNGPVEIVIDGGAVDGGVRGNGARGDVAVDGDANVGGPNHRGQRCIRVRLRDEAPPFDPADAPAPDLDSPLEARDPGGLGWHLVRQFVDALEHHAVPGGGNAYTLVKQLPAPAPAAQEAPQDGHPH